MHQSGKTTVEKERAAELSSSLTLKLYFQSFHHHGNRRLHYGESLLSDDADHMPVCVLPADDSEPLRCEAGDDDPAAARQRVHLAPAARHMRPMPRGPAEAASEAAAAAAGLSAYSADPADGSAWRLHREVEAALAQLGVPARTDCTMHHGAAYPDLFLPPPPAGGAGAGGRGVIVQAHAPACFTGSGRAATDYVRMKQGLLQQQGWTVVAVPHWEWDALPSRAARLAYLAGRVARAGFWADPRAAAAAAAAAADAAAAEAAAAGRGV
jgi:hypothetical protein